MKVDVQPINDDFNGRIIDNVLYNRNSVTTDQIADIFRVGDFIKYPNQSDEEASYLEVGSVTYESGVDFFSEDTS